MHGTIAEEYPLWKFNGSQRETFFIVNLMVVKFLEICSTQT